MRSPVPYRKRTKRLRFGRFLRRILAVEGGMFPYKIHAHPRGAFIVNEFI